MGRQHLHAELWGRDLATASTMPLLLPLPPLHIATAAATHCIYCWEPAGAPSKRKPPALQHSGRAGNGHHASWQRARGRRARAGERGTSVPAACSCRLRAAAADCRQFIQSGSQHMAASGSHAGAWHARATKEPPMCLLEGWMCTCCERWAGAHSQWQRCLLSPLICASHDGRGSQPGLGKEQADRRRQRQRTAQGVAAQARRQRQGGGSISVPRGGRQTGRRPLLPPSGPG